MDLNIYVVVNVSVKLLYMLVTPDGRRHNSSFDVYDICYYFFLLILTFSLVTMVVGLCCGSLFRGGLCCSGVATSLCNLLCSLQSLSSSMASVWE